MTARRANTHRGRLRQTQASTGGPPRLSQAETRLAGWFLLVAVKLTTVVAFHLWSVRVGRRGLAPVVIGGDDGEFYLPVAERLADTGMLPPFTPNVWPIYVGYVMRWTGTRGTLPFKALLLVASIGTAWLGVRLLRRLLADVAGRPTPAGAEVVLAAGLLLFPSTLFVSSYSIYRDAIIFFLAIIVLYLGYEVLLRKKKISALWFVVSLYVTFEFRWYAAVGMAAAVTLWFPITGGVRRRASLKLLGISLLAVAGVVAVWLGVLSQLQPVFEARDYFESTDAQSNIGVSYGASSPVLWPLLFLYSLATNVIGPLPNQIGSASTIAGFVLETPILAYVLWRVWRSPITRTPQALLLVCAAVVWFLLIAVYNDNVGTALRLRVLGYQFLFIIAVADAVARRSARVARDRARRRARRPALTPA